MASTRKQRAELAAIRRETAGACICQTVHMDFGDGMSKPKLVKSRVRTLSSPGILTPDTCIHWQRKARADANRRDRLVHPGAIGAPSGKISASRKRLPSMHFVMG